MTDSCFVRNRRSAAALNTAWSRPSASDPEWRELINGFLAQHLQRWHRSSAASSASRDPARPDGRSRRRVCPRESDDNRTTTRSRSPPVRRRFEPHLALGPAIGAVRRSAPVWRVRRPTLLLVSSAAGAGQSHANGTATSKASRVGVAVDLRRAVWRNTCSTIDMAGDFEKPLGSSAHARTKGRFVSMAVVLPALMGSSGAVFVVQWREWRQWAWRQRR
jgi:hypothetical protein